MDVPETLQSAADKLLKDKIHPLFDDQRYHLADEVVNQIWEQRTKYIPPHSFAFVFDYPRHRITRSINMDLLDSRFPSKTGPNDKSIDIKLYLNHFIKEQISLNLYEIRRVTLDLFNEHMNIFNENPGCYGYASDITILINDNNQSEEQIIHHAKQNSDHESDICHHAIQLIEPIVYNKNGCVTDYFCLITIGGQTGSIPFRSRIVSVNEMYESFDFLKLASKLDLIKLDLVELLNNQLLISHPRDAETRLRRIYITECYYHYYGLSTNRILDIRDISSGTLKKNRERLNKALCALFPTLTNSYKHITKDTNESTSYLNPKIVSNIISDLGFFDSDMKNLDIKVQEED